MAVQSKIDIPGSLPFERPFLSAEDCARVQASIHELREHWTEHHATGYPIDVYYTLGASSSHDARPDKDKRYMRKAEMIRRCFSCGGHVGAQRRRVEPIASGLLKRLTEDDREPIVVGNRINGRRRICCPEHAAVPGAGSATDQAVNGRQFRLDGADKSISAIDIRVDHDKTVGHLLLFRQSRNPGPLQAKRASRSAPCANARGMTRNRA